MSQPYKDGPSMCPKCGAPTHYTASSDTESQGYFGTHRYAPPTIAPEAVGRAALTATPQCGCDLFVGGVPVHKQDCRLWAAAFWATQEQENQK